MLGKSVIPSALPLARASAIEVHGREFVRQLAQRRRRHGVALVRKGLERRGAARAEQKNETHH